MGTLDYGRDTTDAIVREVGTAWWDAARVATPDLLERALREQAAINGVDPGYLRWILLHHRKSWERVSGSTMLQAARRLYLEAVAKGRTDTGALPEDMAGERAADKAIQGLVAWAKGPYADAMVKLFVQVAGPAAEQVKAAIFEDRGERISSKQARQILLTELPLRVRDHPFWFRDPETLQLLVQGLFG